MSTETVLDVRGLAVRYGRREVLTGVDLACRPGEVVALVGRNGEGKTSLVRCLLALQRPEAGTVEVLGRDVWRRRSEVMAEVGYVPESPHAPGWRTAEQLLAWGGAFHARWDEDRAREGLERNRVPLDLPLRSLSQGQRKQVEVAFALASRPRFLVLDDPALGLDPLARRELWDRLVEGLVDDEVSVLFTTHELEAVERIASRVGILHGGRLVVDESLESLRSRYRRLPVGRVRGAEAAETVSTAWGRRRVVADWAGDDDPRLATGERAEPMGLEEIFEAVIREVPR